MAFPCESVRPLAVRAGESSEVAEIVAPWYALLSTRKLAVNTFVEVELKVAVDDWADISVKSSDVSGVGAVQPVGSEIGFHS